MKEYILFIRKDFIPKDGVTLGSREERIEKFANWAQNLHSQDRHIYADALTTNGRFINPNAVSKTDGPFVESKEVLSGFFLFKAESLDEAEKIASTHPEVGYGSAIEVIELAGY